MTSNLTVEKPHWSEIRCDYIDENKDDQFWRVDAWKTDDGNEEGKVIAYIDDLSARVVYCEPIARVDKYAQEVITEKVTEIRKRLVDEKKASIAKAEAILSDNGIDSDEVKTVLQALGYALLDDELYPEQMSEPKLHVVDITLLSLDEYRAAKKYIPVLDGWWWLRSPGSYSSSAAGVSAGGSAYANGLRVYITNSAVRPALFIQNLDSFDLKPGDKILDYAGYDWTVISEDMALCDTEVGTCCFRKNWKAPDANDYNKSDVKKYLEDWAQSNGIITAPDDQGR